MLFKKSGYGFIYDVKANLFVLFTFISIIGSMMVLQYLERIEKEEVCAKLSPKLLDFVKKYNILILVSSIASLVFMWIGII